MHLQRHIINLDTRASSLPLSKRSDCSSNLMARRSTSARIESSRLRTCKPRHVAPCHAEPLVSDGIGGGGWRKRGCKCALLGRAVSGYFRNQDSMCVAGGRTRGAWKIRPIVCQFWISLCSSLTRPSATVVDLCRSS